MGFAAIVGRASPAGENLFGGLPLLPGAADPDEVGPDEVGPDEVGPERPGGAAARTGALPKGAGDVVVDFAQLEVTLLSGITRIVGAQST
jgi:hypothetical protein